MSGTSCKGCVSIDGKVWGKLLSSLVKGWSLGCLNSAERRLEEGLRIYKCWSMLWHVPSTKPGNDAFIVALLPNEFTHKHLFLIASFHGVVAYWPTKGIEETFILERKRQTWAYHCCYAGAHMTDCRNTEHDENIMPHSRFMYMKVDSPDFSEYILEYIQTYILIYVYIHIYSIWSPVFYWLKNMVYSRPHCWSQYPEDF